MQLIDGRALAEKIKNQITKEIYQLDGPRPNLAVVLVGTRADSELYVRLKATAAKQVGVDTQLYRLDADASEAQIIEVINFLNQDSLINGLLVQLPLPTHLNADRVVAAIAPAKDVDGFTPANVANLAANRPETLIPPVLGAVWACLQATGQTLTGLAAAIVAKDGVFSQQLQDFLQARGISAVKLNPDDAHLADQTKQADILITAVGRPGFIEDYHLKNGVIIIDVGISQNAAGQTCGDVAVDQVGTTGWLTPVPGGIGPLTVAFALKNTLECYKKQNNF